MIEKEILLNKLMDLIDSIRLNHDCDRQKELRIISNVFKDLSDATSNFADDNNELGEKLIQLAFFEINSIDLDDL